MELKDFKYSLLKRGINNLTFGFKESYGDGRLHKGIDLIGNPEFDDGKDFVLAYEDGIVESYCNTSTDYTTSKGTEGMGNYVIISHRNNFRTRYQHLEVGTVEVELGQKIKKGQKIGKLGSSGNACSPHLHFDIAKQGCFKDGMWVPTQNRTYFNPCDFLYGEKFIDDDFEEDSIIRVDESTEEKSIPFLSKVEGKQGHYKLNLSIKIKQKNKEVDKDVNSINGS